MRHLRGSLPQHRGTLALQGFHRTAWTNGSITAELLEARVLSGLRDRLLTPEIISRFAAHLQRELDMQQRAASGQRGGLEAELAETRARVSKILKRIEEVDEHLATKAGAPSRNAIRALIGPELLPLR